MPFRYLVQFLCNHQKHDMQFSPVADVRQDFEIFYVPANCICKENILNFISFLASYFVYNLHLISSSIFQQNYPFRLHLTPLCGFRRKKTKNQRQAATTQAVQPQTAPAVKAPQPLPCTTYPCTPPPPRWGKTCDMQRG